MSEQPPPVKPVPDFRERVRAGMAAFSPAERRVARLVLAGPPTIGLESSAKLGRDANVSGPTVIRFANRLGFATYAEFQEALRDEIDARVVSPVSLYTMRTPESPGPRGDVAGAILDATHQTLRNLSVDEFRSAGQLIGNRASAVFSVGGWYSRVHAQYFVALLQEVRPNVRLLDESVPQRVAALVDARRGDVVVAFDFRRYEDATIELLSNFHARGARVVLVTDRWLSPAAAFADVVLSTIVDGPSAFDTLVPAIAVVELLVSGLVEQLDESGQRRFERFTEESGAHARRWGSAESLTSEAPTPSRRMSVTSSKEPPNANGR